MVRLPLVLVEKNLIISLSHNAVYVNKSRKESVKITLVNATKKCGSIEILKIEIFSFGVIVEE